MLTRFNKGLRFRAAIALAALYAFCILLPQAALAYSKNPAHCLTDTSPAHVHKVSTEAKNTHVHSDGSVHSHVNKASAHDDAGESSPHKPAGGDAKHANNCCGLFCISAIAHEAPTTFTRLVVVTRALPSLTEALSGRGPDRINRPPIG